MDRELLLQRAELGGQWAMVNQFKWKESADMGRYARHTDIADEKVRPASCWLQGVQIMAMLALHEATGKEEYLESARMAARYVKTLQQLDARKPANYGYIVETTPQTPQGHPRDALTAAWALLMLHRVEPDDELLDRVMLFANWFASQGMDEYPYWTVYMDGRPPYRMRGSFHGGSPAFFNDLVEITGEKKWIEVSKKIADYHIAHLLKADGSVRITVEPDTHKDLTDSDFEDDHAWEHMHKFNDDFTALAMLKLGQLSGDAKYTEAGLRFAKHLLAHQDANGGYGNPVVPSASGVGALTLVRAAQVDPANRETYWRSVERAADHMLSLQELDNDHPRYHGGFYGQAEGDFADWRDQFGRRSTIHLRTHAYSTIALAMLSGRCRRSYYNVAVQS